MLRFWSTILLVVIPIGAAFCGVDCYVPATADIYLAGQPDGTVIRDTVCQQSDARPQQAAFEVSGISLDSGYRLHFNVSGLASHTVTGQIGPDGFQGLLTCMDPVTGVGTVSDTGNTVRNQAGPLPLPFSGHRYIPLVALIGVFTGDSVPAVGTQSDLPESLDFGSQGLGRDFQLLRPALRQVFFIGDGRAQSGAMQEFVIPSGAKHFYLAVSDGPGCYVNNSGGFTVSMEAVPEPSGLLALACGSGGLGLLQRRRR